MSSSKPPASYRHHVAQWLGLLALLLALGGCIAYARSDGSQALTADLLPEPFAQVWMYGAFALAATLGLLLHQQSRRSFVRLEQVRESALRAGDARLRALFEATPDAVLISDAQGLITMANQQCEVLLGYAMEELPGRSIEELMPMHARGNHQILRDVFAATPSARRMSSGVAVKAMRKNGSEFDVEVSLSRIETDDGIHFVSALRDISARKRTEDFEGFRARTLEFLAGNMPLCSLLETLVRGIEQIDPSMRCSILLLSADGQRLGRGIAPSLPDFYNAATDGIQIGLGAGSCGTAAFTGQPVIVEDIASHPYWAALTSIAAQAGLGACWSQPIIASGGEVLGTLGVYHDRPHRQSAADKALIEQAAHLASIAIEKRRSADQLIHSEQRFRKLTEMSSDFYWESDCDHRISQRTQSKRELADARFEPAAIIGQLRWEVPHCTPDATGWLAHRALLEAHMPFRDFEISRSGAGGTVHHVSICGDPIFNASGEFTGYRGVGSDITERHQSAMQLRVAAAAFESEVPTMVADHRGVVLRVNRAFVASTGYAPEEIVGQNPDMLQSGRHDKAFYRLMWRSIKRTGVWQGEIWDRRKNGEVYPKWLTISAVRTDDGIVTHYIGTHQDNTERLRATEKIRELAFFDQLTGLSNRTVLLDRLGQAMTGSGRSASFGALLFIDLDHFKTLNDTQGHDMGDRLLKQVAQRLQSCMREGDTVARLGGDDFVVILAGLNSNEVDAATDTEAVATKIIATLGLPYQLGEAPHSSTCSIGASLFQGHRASIDDVMRQADLAMYRAKDAGRNAMRFFDPIMETVVVKRVAMERDLREAVAAKQFVLHYQAQVQGHGLITGAEVLVRWLHPERGMVVPADFIPLAEETGVILPLGNWVLEAACIQLAKWRHDPGMEHLTLAVNVSALQFAQADFVQQVMAIVGSTGANPQRLKLELTESLLVGAMTDIIEKMFSLKGQGLGFALDDFGTGFSSLSYLSRLPLDQLKIDKSFISDVLINSRNAAIARTIIALADSLGLGVIAEGVEADEERKFLANAGCHAYQGYLFSRPLPLDGFEDLVREASRSSSILSH